MIDSLLNPSIFHHPAVEIVLEECTDVIGSTITWHDILARGNIDMRPDGVGECLGDTVLWPAGDDQLELVQMVFLNLALERT